MSDAVWDRSPSYRQSSVSCPKCGAPPEAQVSFRGPTGNAWRCERCHSQTSVDLPFDPRVAPEGREEAYLAIQTLCVFAPIFSSVDTDLIYEIVRPYFVSGWCVRDVIHAINYLPDGETHPGQGAAWVRGEDRDRTLSRLRTRLRKWRWTDRDEGSDVMHGPYTAMVSAMQRNADMQVSRAGAREAEWHLRATAAENAREAGAPEIAKRQAAIAAGMARRARREAEEAEREWFARELERNRSHALDWLSANQESTDS